MKWFLQSNLVPDDQEDLITAITNFGNKIEFFEAIPFDRQPPKCPEGPFFPMGTVNAINNIATVRPDTTMVYPNSFNYDSYLRELSDVMLNHNTIKGALKSIIQSYDVTPQLIEFPVFMRPLSDNKEFAGAIFHDEREWYKFCTDIIKGETAIDPEVEVLLAPPQWLEEEWRVIVVGYKIACYSRYRRKGHPNYSTSASLEMLQFVHEVINRWKPAPIFAIDIAVTDAGFKVIEFGSIHSCGLYNCDRNEFVKHIDGYFRV